MAGKTPKRVSGPAQVSNAAATKYTVPANTIAVIRRMHVQNPSGAAVAFTASIGADAAGTRILDAFSIPAAGAGITESVKDFWGPYTMTAGEILQAFASTNNILTLTIDADEYTL